MIPWAKPHLFGDEEKYLVDAIRSTWISGGKYVDKLEEGFGELIGSKNVISTSNGTTALSLALLGLGIRPGDEVIVPGFCFVAPGNTVLAIGAKPVYADVEEDTWNINPDEIKKAITPQTKAIIVVHNYGNVCDMDKIMQIAKENNLYVIEDTAEAMFSKYNGKHAGTFGDVGCFSFQATKTITTGEGGAIVTDNSELAEKMRKFRNHGMTSKRYWHDCVGYNFRLTNLQAALGVAQFERLQEILDGKRRVYRIYLERLKDVNGITFQKIPAEVEPIIWATAIKLNHNVFGERDSVIEKLKERGIDTRPGFYPFSVMPFYNAQRCPTAELISNDIIVLPIFPSLTEEEIDFICKELKNMGEESSESDIMDVPLAEVIDRLSIVRLKIERVGEPHLQKEFDEYKKALKEFENKGVIVRQEWFNRLYEINGMIWDREWEMRGVINSDDVWGEAEKKIGFAELGKRALEVGDLITERVAIKNQIAEETGSGFKEKKIDHSSV